MATWGKRLKNTRGTPCMPWRSVNIFSEGSKVPFHLQEVTRKTKQGLHKVLTRKVTPRWEAPEGRSGHWLTDGDTKIQASSCDVTGGLAFTLMHSSFPTHNGLPGTLLSPQFWPPRAWLMQKVRKIHSLTNFLLDTHHPVHTVASQVLWGVLCWAELIHTWPTELSQVVSVNSEEEMNPDDNSDCTFSLKLPQENSPLFYLLMSLSTRHLIFCVGLETWLVTESSVCQHPCQVGHSSCNSSSWESDSFWSLDIHVHTIQTGVLGTEFGSSARASALTDPPLQHLLHLTPILLCLYDYFPIYSPCSHPSTSHFGDTDSTGSRKERNVGWFLIVVP